MNSKIIQIMIFYAVLTFGIGPYVGYRITHSIDGLTYGQIVGFILSIILWYKFGIMLAEKSMAE
jgi:hypothetical protein